MAMPDVGKQQRRPKVGRKEAKGRVKFLGVGNARVGKSHGNLCEDCDIHIELSRVRPVSCYTRKNLFHYILK